MAHAADGRRALLATASPLGSSSSGFPWRRCKSYECRCNPYDLTRTNNQTVTSSGTQTCFVVSYRGCNTSLPCCAALLAAVDKLTLEVPPACGGAGGGAAASNIAAVTVNGTRHVSWSVVPRGDTHELRIYDLSKSNATLPGSRICVTSKPDTGCPRTLCDSAPSTTTTISNSSSSGSSKTKGSACRYAWTDSSAPPASCPVCPIQQQPPRACSSCLEIRLSPREPESAVPYRFSKAVCAKIASTITADWNAAVANASGVAGVIKRFSLTYCDPTQLTICGAFSYNNRTAVSYVADAVGELLSIWYWEVLPESTLPDIPGPWYGFDIRLDAGPGLVVPGYEKYEVCIGRSLSIEPSVSYAICGQWYTTGYSESCTAIANMQGLSVDLLRRLNPTLNCAAVQAKQRLCVNKFSQWALTNCRQTVTVWDGDTCAFIASRFPATLPYGVDDLQYINIGIPCSSLLRGMLVCVAGP